MIHKLDIYVTGVLVGILLIAASTGSVAAQMAGFQSGNAEDVHPKLHGPGANLDGGTGKDFGFQELIDSVRGCKDCDRKLDVVVLGTGGSSKRQADYYIKRISALKGVDSVEVLFFENKSAADSAEMATKVSSAEVVQFLGGAQCTFLEIFAGSKVQEAVASVYRRGGGVGGISAGAAIMSKYIYDGCGVLKLRKTMTSDVALLDPYDEIVSFSEDFLELRFLDNVIVDTHVVKRDRLGRTFSFVARQIQDRKLKSAFAIAVDEQSSVTVGPKGIAQVVGSGPAYFILGDHKPEICEKGRPLTYSNFKVWKRMPGETFNLKKRPKVGFYTVSISEGKLSRNPY